MERQFVSAASPNMGRAGAGGRPCQGVWYPPTGRPKAAVIATHYDIDFSEHYLAEYLAERDLGFLGWNTRYRGMGSYFSLDNALIDIGVGVTWLRENAGVSSIVLLGNSGGASLMGAYQSQALEPNISPGPGMTLPDAVGALEPTELFVSLNAHPGRPDVLTAWLDPAVTDESDPLSVDPSLDMFDPAHPPPFSDDFVARYRAAQVERNHRITAWAQAELERLTSQGAWDRTFGLYRAWADLRFVDLNLDPSDRAVGCYFGDPRFANYGPFNLGGTNTLRAWLSMWSLSESQCRAEAHLARITQPALVVQATEDQGCYPSDARAIHAALASEDKSLEWTKGDHYLLSRDGLRAEVADLIADWVKARV